MVHKSRIHAFIKYALSHFNFTKVQTKPPGSVSFSYTMQQKFGSWRCAVHNVCQI